MVGAKRWRAGRYPRWRHERSGRARFALRCLLSAGRLHAEKDRQVARSHSVAASARRDHHRSGRPRLADCSRRSNDVRQGQPGTCRTLRTRFSTMFAVRSASIEAGSDLRTTPITCLLRTLVESGFQSTAGIDSCSSPNVVYFMAGGKPPAPRPLPDFSKSAAPSPVTTPSRADQRGETAVAGSVHVAPLHAQAGRTTSCSRRSCSLSYRLNADAALSSPALRYRSSADGYARLWACCTSYTIGGSSPCSIASAEMRRSEDDKNSARRMLHLTAPRGAIVTRVPQVSGNTLGERSVV